MPEAGHDRVERSIPSHLPSALHVLSDGFHAERVIGEWIGFYNTERPLSALAGWTPAEAYGAGRPVDMVDKARALPTSARAHQQQQDVINKDLAA